jgi:hypothetical protein
MKIDIECINHNAIKTITEVVYEPTEYIDNPRQIIATLNQVKGILLMAEAMKEVLKA